MVADPAVDDHRRGTGTSRSRPGIRRRRRLPALASSVSRARVTTIWGSTIPLAQGSTGASQRQLVSVGVVASKRLPCGLLSHYRIASEGRNPMARQSFPPPACQRHMGSVAAPLSASTGDDCARSHFQNASRAWVVEPGLQRGTQETPRVTASRSGLYVVQRAAVGQTCGPAHVGALWWGAARPGSESVRPGCPQTQLRHRNGWLRHVESALFVQRERAGHATDWLRRAGLVAYLDYPTLIYRAPGESTAFRASSARQRPST